MTLETALAWSAGRSLIVASIAWLLSRSVSHAITHTGAGSRRRQMLTVAALLPLFVPDLLIGFTYRFTSAELVHSVVGTESLYAVLLLCRVVALQVAIQLILPDSAVSVAAVHTWNLHRSRRGMWRFTWLRLQVFGPARTPLVCWLGGVLLCFQEFEKLRS